MFRYLESALPPDFPLAKDLKELGYVINKDDQIRMIDHPESDFHYYASTNDRFVQQNSNAMDQCVNEEVKRRMAKLGYKTTRLPLGTTPDEPHVPILVSPNIQESNRVIVVIGEQTENVGMLSGNITSKVKFSKGCMEEFCTHIRDIKPAEKRPGVIITNPGQTIWWVGAKRAITPWAWTALPRKSCVLPGFMIGNANKIPLNDTPGEHVQCVIDQVLEPLMKAGKKIDIIMIGDVCDVAIERIQTNWAALKKSVEAIVLCSGFAREIEFVDKDFELFWSKRARTYTIDDSPVETPLPGYLKSGCNIYSCGAWETLSNVGHEGIMVETWPYILKYFDMVHNDPDYAEEITIVQEPVEKESQEDQDDETQSSKSEERIQDIHDSDKENKSVESESKITELDSESEEEDKSRKIGGLEALIEACKIEPEKKTKGQRRAERIVEENRHMFE